MTDTYREALCARRLEELRQMVTPKRVEPVQRKTLEELAAEVANLEIEVSAELLANIAERDARLKGE